MEFYVNTRFGDPVLSMDMRESFLVYGTALGQLGFVDIASKEHALLTEITEESIRGIHLSPTGVVYAAVGDLYILCLVRTESGEWHMEGLSHEGREHTSLLCTMTQVLQDKSKICLVIVKTNKEEEDILTEAKSKLSVTNAKKSETEEWAGLVLPYNAVPLDFRGKRLLWLEKDLDMNRSLKLMFLAPLKHHSIMYLGPNYGSISHVQILKENVILVRNFRRIERVDIMTGEFTGSVGEHDADIVAIFALFYEEIKGHELEDSERNGFVNNELVLSVDKTGLIVLWNGGRKLEEINLTDNQCVAIDSRERLFSLGYPYVIRAGGVYISVSTDLGIFIVKSSYLSETGGIYSAIRG